MKKIVLISWVDCTTLEGWGEERDIDEAIKHSKEVLTVGFLLKETDKEYVVCQSYEDVSPIFHEKFGDVCLIPKRSVEKVEEVRKLE
jgi:hypothetical protein